MTRKEIILELKELMTHVPDRFLQIEPAELECKPAPEKWSKKEILGHLVDSAINNLIRFTQAQYDSSPYKVVPYHQNELVKLNHYAQQAGAEIAQLWQTLNRQILRIIANCPEEKLKREIILPDGQLFTLEWLMEDYLTHLKHHLRQIFGS